MEGELIITKEMQKQNRIKGGRGRLAFNIVNYTFLVLLSLIFIVPYINMIAKAFSTNEYLTRNGVLFWPGEWTWANFSSVLKDPLIVTGFRNTIIRVVVASALSLFLDYTAAYALLRKGLHFRKAIVMFLTIPMFVSGGLIGEYIIYGKKWLNLIDTFWVYIFPWSFSFYNMVLIRSYLQGIPEAVLESARIDGANEITILWKIMLPLSLPIIATILLFCAVANWNDWTRTLYFVLYNKDLYVLQYILYLAKQDVMNTQKLIDEAIQKDAAAAEIEVQSVEALQAAQIIVATLPIVCLYPFVQRYFMGGMMLGSVKE